MITVLSVILHEVGVWKSTSRIYLEISLITPNNIHNSEILLNLVDKIKPDIVHIQYEPGLYGLKLYSYRPSKIFTTIDSFYEESHSHYLSLILFHLYNLFNYIFNSKDTEY